MVYNYMEQRKQSKIRDEDGQSVRAYQHKMVQSEILIIQ